jgi:plasmid stabilization system protein ParE
LERLNRIVFTDEAKADLRWLRKYVRKFGNAKENDIRNDLQRVYERLSTNPEYYPVYKANPLYRHIRFHPNTRIYFRYFPEEQLVEITRLFDQRQHPDSLGL